MPIQACQVAQQATAVHQVHQLRRITQRFPLFGLRSCTCCCTCCFTCFYLLRYLLLYLLLYSLLYLLLYLLLEKLERMHIRDFGATPYVSIRQHASAYVSMRQHTSAYVRTLRHIQHVPAPPSKQEAGGAPSHVCTSMLPRFAHRCAERDHPPPPSPTLKLGLFHMPLWTYLIGLC